MSRRGGARRSRVDFSFPAEESVPLRSVRGRSEGNAEQRREAGDVAANIEAQILEAVNSAAPLRSGRSADRVPIEVQGDLVSADVAVSRGGRRGGGGGSEIRVGRYTMTVRGAGEPLQLRHSAAFLFRLTTAVNELNRVRGGPQFFFTAHAYQGRGAVIAAAGLGQEDDLQEMRERLPGADGGSISGAGSSRRSAAAAAAVYSYIRGDDGGAGRAFIQAGDAAASLDYDYDAFAEIFRSGVVVEEIVIKFTVIGRAPAGSTVVSVDSRFRSINWRAVGRKALEIASAFFARQVPQEMGGASRTVTAVQFIRRTKKQLMAFYPNDNMCFARALNAALLHSNLLEQGHDGQKEWKKLYGAPPSKWLEAGAFSFSGFDIAALIRIGQQVTGPNYDVRQDGVTPLMFHPISEYFGINLIVLDIGRFYAPVYIHDRQHVRTTVVLAVLSTDDCKHVFYMPTPAKFFKKASHKSRKVRFCTVCGTYTTSIMAHLCAPSIESYAQTCALVGSTVFDQHLEALEARFLFADKNSPFSGVFIGAACPFCWEHHDDVFSEEGPRELLADDKKKTGCLDCGRVIHISCMRGHLANGVCTAVKECANCHRSVRSDALNSHVCGAFYCRVCKVRVEEVPHICYIDSVAAAKGRGIILKPTPEKIAEATVAAYKYTVAFDFETFIHDRETGQIKVNMICWATLSDISERGEAAVQCLTGQDCLDRFVKEHFLKERAKDDPRITYLAHNGKGFDFKFILEYMTSNTDQKISVTMRGRKILCAEFENKTRLVCTLSHLPMSLASMPKAFGFSDVTKGFFPHELNCLVGNDDSKAEPFLPGVFPQKSLFKPEFMRPDDAKNFEIWHAEQTQIFSSQNIVYNVVSEMRKYCVADVAVLGKAAIAFISDMYTSFGMNPFEMLTSASLSFKIFCVRYLPLTGVKISVPPAAIQEFIRRSFLGGRTEVFVPFIDLARFKAALVSHGASAEQLDLKIVHSDVTSLYPTVMLDKFPVGVPFVRDPSDFSFICDEVFLRKRGLFFVQLSLDPPPDSSPFYGMPFVPFKGTRLRFSYEPACMNDVVLDSATLETALEFGYTVVPGSVCKILFWTEEQCGKIFEGFVNDLFKKRLEAKRNKNTSMDLLFKIVLNSLWGRFAMRRDVPDTQIVRDTDQPKLASLLESRTRFIKSVVELGEHQLAITTAPTAEELQLNNAGTITNIAVAAFVTSLARRFLYRKLSELHQASTREFDRIAPGFPPFAPVCPGGPRASTPVLYCDTDSIYAVVPTRSIAETVLPHSKELGGWGDELKGAGPGGADAEIRQACFIGPKCYTVVYADEHQTAKAKGVSTNLSSSAVLNFNTFCDLLKGVKTHVYVDESFRVMSNATFQLCQRVSTEDATKIVQLPNCPKRYIYPQYSIEDWISNYGFVPTAPYCVDRPFEAVKWV